MSGMRVVVIGLSITSSWGNGHATTYRALLRALAARGHDILFLERDVPWYAEHRDLAQPPFCRTALYGSLAELKDRYASNVRSADLVIVGSFVPQGAEVGEWVVASAHGVTAFYDIDTPVTLARLDAGDTEYLSRELVPRYDLYLSFTGGPVLDVLEQRYGARCARPLYCAVDAAAYAPDPGEPLRWDLGYMGTWSEDRQPPLERLMLSAARAWPEGRFTVVGPQYPDHIAWPPNVQRRDHSPPGEHRAFYCAQRFTLNVTRAAMVRVGHAPSVRLFEAAACGVPVISDEWPGLDEYFRTGSELLVARSAADTLAFLRDMTEAERCAIGERARQRVLREHTAEHRALALEQYAAEARGVVEAVS